MPCDSSCQSNFDVFWTRNINVYFRFVPNRYPMQSQNFATFSLKVQLVCLMDPQLGLIISNVTLTFSFFYHFQFLEFLLFLLRYSQSLLSNLISYD